MSTNGTIRRTLQRLLKSNGDTPNSTPNSTCTDDKIMLPDTADDSLVLDRMVANAHAHERTMKALDDIQTMLKTRLREVAEWDKGYAAGFEAGRLNLTCWNRICQWLVGWF